MSQLKLVLFLSAIGLAAACLITNCPKGGKRSSELTRLQPKQCTRCGPSLEGRCIGPALCCGPRFGCLFGAPAILSQCQRSMPRALKGMPCTVNTSGVCVSDGVCCTSDTCTFDLGCEMDSFLDPCSLGE